MIWELFLVGSFWFWAIIIVESFWLIRCLHEESGTGIGGSLIGLALLLWLFGDFNIFAWIYANPLPLLQYVAGYFVVGGLWSVIRFKLLCTDARDLLEETKQEFKEQHEITGGIPTNMREKWRKFAGSRTWPGNRWSTSMINSIEDVIPKPRENKATIMYWIGYWPLSVIWFFLHDVIERVVRACYRRLTKMFEAIARSTFAGVEDDFGGDK